MPATLLHRSRARLARHGAAAAGGASLVFLLLAPPGAGAPFRPPGDREEGRLAGLLEEIEGLVAAQQGAHPHEARDIERRIQRAGREVAGLGPEAVQVLSLYVRDAGRPHKARLYAAALLGLAGDPGALVALKSLALDRHEEPGLRAAAVSGLASLRLDRPDMRRTLESIAGDPNSVEPVRREAWLRLIALGAGDLRLAEKAAKSGGAAPGPGADAVARHALAALGASPDPAAGALLLELTRFYRAGSPMRGEALAALETRRMDWRDFDAADVRRLIELMNGERGPAALRAARLLRRLAHPDAANAFLYALDAPDPELIAEAAEALVEAEHLPALEHLRRLSDGLLTDKRFQPRRRGPDAAVLAARVQKAADDLAERAVPRPEPPPPAEPSPEAAEPLAPPPPPEASEPGESPRAESPAEGEPAPRDRKAPLETGARKPGASAPREPSAPEGPPAEPPPDASEDPLWLGTSPPGPKTAPPASVQPAGKEPRRKLRKGKAGGERD